jgi:hypothetical protein
LNVLSGLLELFLQSLGILGLVVQHRQRSPFAIHPVQPAAQNKLSFACQWYVQRARQFAFLPAPAFLLARQLPTYIAGNGCFPAQGPGMADKVSLDGAGKDFPADVVQSLLQHGNILAAQNRIDAMEAMQDVVHVFAVIALFQRGGYLVQLVQSQGVTRIELVGASHQAVVAAGGNAGGDKLRGQHGGGMSREVCRLTADC